MSSQGHPLNTTLLGPAPKAGDPVNVIDPKFFNEVAQFAHAGVAGLIFLAIGHLAQTASLFHWWWYGILVAIGVALAAWKEFWYDPHYENAATRGSDLEDFAFYMVGIVIAVVVILL